MGKPTKSARDQIIIVLTVSVGELRKKIDHVYFHIYIDKYICIKVQYLRVQSVYIHHIINNIYYNSAGIVTIFLHYVLCMIFRNNVDYMYKYSQTWKFPEQVKSYLVSMYS